MKKVNLIALLLIGMVATAFANGKGTAKKVKVNTAESEIKWVGEKVTGKHEGTIQLKDGSLELKNGKLKGGSFVIDMTTIACTDLEGEYAQKLEGHLESDDFFGTANHKTGERNSKIT